MTHSYTHIHHTYTHIHYNLYAYTHTLPLVHTYITHTHTYSRIHQTIYTHTSHIHIQIQDHGTKALAECLRIPPPPTHTHTHVSPLSTPPAARVRVCRNLQKIDLERNHHIRCEFWKIGSIVVLYSRYARGLTFENFWQ